MEDVTHVQSELTSARPPGTVFVDRKALPATVYAKADGLRPVEDTEIFFKELVGTLQTAPLDPRGKLLLTIDLDFSHGNLLSARKQNYAYNKYKEIRVEGKRTDVIFGRSGSIGVIYTTNPWYQLSATDNAANALAAQSDPTYRVLTISDTLDMDLSGMIKDFVREGGWYFANPGESMPLDYHIAGRIFFLTEIPPQILSYELPVYLAGTVQVKDYIPTELSALTFSKTRIEGDIRLVQLTWDSEISQYVVDVYVNSLITGNAVGSYLPDQSQPMSITIREVPEAGEAADELDPPTEVHSIIDYPCKVINATETTLLEFRTTISKLSNFNVPELVEYDIPDQAGWGVFEDSVPMKYRSYKGIPLDSMPTRSVNMRPEVFSRAVGPETLANMRRVARGGRPLVVTRPIGADISDIARLAHGARV